MRRAGAACGATRCGGCPGAGGSGHYRAHAPEGATERGAEGRKPVGNDAAKLVRVITPTDIKREVREILGRHGPVVATERRVKSVSLYDGIYPANCSSGGGGHVQFMSSAFNTLPPGPTFNPPFNGGTSPNLLV